MRQIIKLKKDVGHINLDLGHEFIEDLKITIQNMENIKKISIWTNKGLRLVEMGNVKRDFSTTIQTYDNLKNTSKTNFKVNKK